MGQGCHTLRSDLRMRSRRWQSRRRKKEITKRRRRKKRKV